MKVICVETDRSLNRYLQENGCLCQFLNSEDINELNKKNGKFTFKKIVILDLDKVKHLPKRNVSIVFIGISEKQQSYDKCIFVAEKNSNGYEQILNKIGEIYSETRFMPLGGIKELWISVDALEVLYKDTIALISSKQWAILNYLNQPNKAFTLDDIYFYCFDEGDDEYWSTGRHNVIQVYLAKLKTFFKALIGENIILSGKLGYRLSGFVNDYEMIFSPYNFKLKLNDYYMLRDFYNFLVKKINSIASKELQELKKKEWGYVTTHSHSRYYFLYSLLRRNKKRKFSPSNFSSLLLSIYYPRADFLHKDELFLEGLECHDQYAERIQDSSEDKSCEKQKLPSKNNTEKT